MKKVLFIAVALIVCTSFSFASGLESESFDVYALDPLSASVLDYAVMPLADASWSTTDSQNLENILEAITPSSLVSNPSLYTLVRYLESNSDSILSALVGSGGSITYPASGSIVGLLQYLPNLVSLQSMEYNLDYIDESADSIELGVSDLLTSFLNAFSTTNYYYRGGIAYSWRSAVGNILTNLTYEGVNPFYSDGRETTYSYIKRLASVLATKEDLELSESQKSNREEIENTFLTGSSSSTSLGASDFGDLSDVGGTVNDTLSLNGQASISSFTSGLSGADQEGQNWFSAATRDSLDSVSGGVSTFALDDPYNMAGWYDRYVWVEGD